MGWLGVLKIQLKWSREDDGLRPSCEHWRVGRRGGAAVLLGADGWRCTALGHKRLPPRMVPHNNTTNVKLYHLTICSTWAGFKNLSPCVWRRHRRRPSCHLSRARWYVVASGGSFGMLLWGLHGESNQLTETLSVGEKFGWNSSAGGSPCAALHDFSIVCYTSFCTAVWLLWSQ